MNTGGVGKVGTHWKAGGEAWIFSFNMSELEPSYLNVGPPQYTVEIMESQIHFGWKEPLEVQSTTVFKALSISQDAGATAPLGNHASIWSHFVWDPVSE